MNKISLLFFFWYQEFARSDWMGLSFDLQKWFWEVGKFLFSNLQFRITYLFEIFVWNYFFNFFLKFCFQIEFLKKNSNFFLNLFNFFWFFLNWKLKKQKFQNQKFSKKKPSQMFGPKTSLTRGPEWPHRCSVQKRGVLNDLLHVQMGIAQIEIGPQLKL